MEWGAPPSPVLVVQPSPAKPQPSLVRLKLQLALEQARADASERALSVLVPAMKEAGVLPATYDTLFS